MGYLQLGSRYNTSERVTREAGEELGRRTMGRSTCSTSDTGLHPAAQLD